MKIMFDSKVVNRTKTFKAERYVDENGSTRFVLTGLYNINIADGLSIKFYISDAYGNKFWNQHTIKPELVSDENYQEWGWAMVLIDDSGLPAPITSFYGGIDLYASVNGYNDISLSFADFETNTGTVVYDVEITGVISDLVIPIGAGI